MKKEIIRVNAGAVASVIVRHNGSLEFEGPHPGCSEFAGECASYFHRQIVKKLRSEFEITYLEALAMAERATSPRWVHFNL
jgi:hypothetical protein